MLKAELKEMKDNLLEQVEELNREREEFYEVLGQMPDDPERIKSEMERLKERNKELEMMTKSLNEQLDDLYEEKEYLLSKYPNFSPKMVESMEKQLTELYKHKDANQSDTSIQASGKDAKDDELYSSQINEEEQPVNWQRKLANGGVLFNNCTVNIHQH